MLVICQTVHIPLQYTPLVNDYCGIAWNSNIISHLKQKSIQALEEHVAKEEEKKKRVL